MLVFYWGDFILMSRIMILMKTLFLSYIISDLCHHFEIVDYEFKVQVWENIIIPLLEKE